MGISLTNEFDKILFKTNSMYSYILIYLYMYIYLMYTLVCFLRSQLSSSELSELFKQLGNAFL